LADEIDILLEGYMNKICRATGKSREELQRELARLELEEDPQLESVSDETTTTITTTAAEEEDVSRFFQEAQADPILTHQDLLLTPILPPLSRPPPTTTASTTIDTDILEFHSSNQTDPVITPQEIHSPVLRPVSRPRRGRFHQHLINRRLARAREQQREQEDDEWEGEGEEEGQAGRVIRVRLPGQAQVRRVRRHQVAFSFFGFELDFLVFGEVAQTQNMLNIYSFDNNRQLTRVLQAMEAKKKEKEEMIYAVAQLGKANFQITEVFHPTRLSGLW